MTVASEVDTSKAYRVDGYPGVAWRVLGPAQVWAPDYEVEDPNEPGEFYDVESVDSGDYVDSPHRVRAVMVGDDREFEHDVADLHPLGEDEYCHGCGQTGCGHDVRDANA